MTRMTQSQDGPVMQLATRIPESLHYRLKVYAVQHDISIMRLVIEALEWRIAQGTDGTRS
jgi:predicted HicB family RNase H-like nuclease